MSVNWLEGMNHHMDGPDRPTATPVFAGQKLVVVGPVIQRTGLPHLRRRKRRP